jgi:drug/metabolite transporter (DMT)-like permease
VSGSVPSMLIIAVPAALVGAASFGTASALQQRATKDVPTTAPLDPRLLLDLIRRPMWVLATGTVVIGLALQVVALAYAPLALVQPLLVTGILFGTLVAARLARHRLDTQVLFGASAAVVGLAAFLSLAQPRDTSGTLPGFSGVLPLALVLVAIVAGCLVIAVASRFSGSAHVGALATATGVCYGVTAGLMKVVTSQIRGEGITEIFQHPAFYVVCLIGPAGFLLSQNTFQQGVLIAPALAVITIVDPLVGIAIGMSWLDEQLNTSPPVLGGQLVSGLVLIVGVVLLARRGTQLRHEIEQQASRGSPPPAMGGG